MRVHLVHQSFRDYVSCLTTAVGERCDLRVTTISSGAPKRTIMSTGRGAATVRLPRFRDPRSPLAALRAVNALRGDDVDVIHWQAAGNPWVDLALRIRLPSVPLVVTVHDMEPHPGDENVIPGTFAAIRSLARVADMVIVHAEEVRQQAISHGVSPTRVVVVPHGELGSIYLPAGGPPLPPSTGNNVLFFGRVHGYKGVPDLITAMAAVRRTIPDATLTIAGSGAERFSADDAPWLTILDGHVPDDQVVPLFTEAALVALPYREASQSGVAALAAGLGRAVVASAVGGLTEMVDHGTSGLLVRPADTNQLAAAIVELLADTERRHSMETGAHERANGSLSWPSIAVQTVEIYSSVLAQASSAAPSSEH